VRFLVRALSAAALVFLAVAAALWWVAPRVLESPALRDRITAALREATGSEVHYERLAVGVLPPRVVVEAPSIAPQGEAVPPFARAERVDLAFAFGALLERQLEIEAIEIEGAVLELVRTERGIALAGSAAAAGQAPAGERGPASGSAPGDESAAERAAAPAALPFLVRRVVLRDSQLGLEDRSVLPALRWSLVEIDLDTRAESRGAPIAFTLAGRLESGGRLRAEGTLTSDAALDVSARLEEVDVAPVAAYLSEDRRLRGRVGGTLRVSGPAASPRSIDTDLVLDEGELRADRLWLRGKVGVRAKLQGDGKGAASLAGRFDLDATDAELVYGEGSFQKPAGMPATASGQLKPQPDGSFGLDDVRVKIRNAEGRGRLTTGARTRLSLDVPRFEVAVLEELFPALAGRGLSGSAVLSGLALETAPVSLRGRLALEGVEVGTQGGSVRLVGALVGSGDRIETQQLIVSAGPERIAVAGSLAGLGRERPALSLRLDSRSADVGKALRAFGVADPLLEGPLAVNGALAGELRDGALDRDSVSGTVRLDGGPGRIRGVSFLDRTMRGITALVGAEVLEGLVARGGTPRDDFRRLSGTFAIEGGVARSRDLRIVYDGYRVDLAGSLGLFDRHLDATGRLTLLQELDVVLGGRTAGKSGGVGEIVRSIELAHVGGTLDAPEIELSRAAVLAFLAGSVVGRGTKLPRTLESGPRQGRKLLEKLGEAVLPGTGKAAGEPPAEDEAANR
jgi:hypothetical protein